MKKKKTLQQQIMELLIEGFSFSIGPDEKQARVAKLEVVRNGQGLGAKVNVFDADGRYNDSARNLIKALHTYSSIIEAEQNKEVAKMQSFMQNLQKDVKEKRSKAPWKDYKGNDIYEGDTIQHPSGETGVVIFRVGLSTDPENQWLVDYYSDLAPSRLCLQIGDKGQAVVKKSIQNRPDVSKYLKPDDSDLFKKALKTILISRKVSTSYIQRMLKLNYNQASSLIDEMEKRKIIDPQRKGGVPREILITDMKEIETLGEILEDM